MCPWSLNFLIFESVFTERTNEQPPKSIEIAEWSPIITISGIKTLFPASVTVLLQLNGKYVLIAPLLFVFTTLRVIYWWWHAVTCSSVGCCSDPCPRHGELSLHEWLSLLMSRWHLAWYQRFCMCVCESANAGGVKAGSIPQGKLYRNACTLNVCGIFLPMKNNPQCPQWDIRNFFQRFTVEIIDVTSSLAFKARHEGTEWPVKLSHQQRWAVEIFDLACLTQFCLPWRVSDRWQQGIEWKWRKTPSCFKISTLKEKVLWGGGVW